MSALVAGPLDLGSWFANTALDGSLVLAVPVALIAGLVSFFSPCVVPLLPGYLSYMTGLGAADLGAARRGRMVAGALLFIAGFAAVFILIGVAFGAAGEWLFRYQDQLRIWMGVATILLGIAFLGAIPLLQRDVRVHKLPAVGLAAAPMLGVLFGLGWTPCLGPTLSAINLLGAQEGSIDRAVALSVCYCLGLGVPFVLAAVAYRRMMGAVGWVRRHQQWVTRLGGAMLITVGLLLVTGWWDYWVDEIRQYFFPGFTAGV
jgi:cytochrome c-type biogenesis protein